MKISYVDGPRLRRSLVAACSYASLQRGELNRINVYPVPDGDTGTNLALTVQAIADRLRGSRERSVSVVAHEAAQAAVLGARGNCGMILSHFLLGFSRHFEEGQTRISTEEFAEALTSGVEHLYAALEKPVEGTILTVMRETAEAADDAGMPDFVPLVDHLVDRARDSLERTPELLPVLEKAGVVDAGAKGFVAMLEGVLLFIHGDPIVAPAATPPAERRDAVGAAAVEFGAEDEMYRFCTEALVRGDALPTQDEAKDWLRHLGDSLIVIRADDVLKVHIHTDEPDVVFDWLRTKGRLETHKAEDMRAQHATVGRASAGGHVSLARRPISIVTDSAADLPENVVRAHGIHVTPLALIDGDETLRDRVDISAEEFQRRLADEPDTLPTTSQPSPADFLEAFNRAAEDGEQVLAVLLGSTLSGTLGSAEAASKRVHGAEVTVVDTLGASLLEGLLVLKAAELAELAKPPAEIAEEIRRIREQSGILFTVETFERLLASGRVGRGRAFLGSMLNVKPILYLNEEGVVEPAGKAFGSSRGHRVHRAMIDTVKEKVGGAEKVRFGVVHVGCPEILPQVSGALRSHFGPNTEVLASPATPVISTHLGIGAWGVAWIVED
jgi:DAK2 domain fusion protein YloV